jgi:sortase B
MEKKSRKLSRRAIKGFSFVVDTIILTIILLMLAFAGYSIWDSHQIHQGADRTQYERFKPILGNESTSFEELQEINPEVIAWLTVYGTNIDYPVTQGKDNMKYVNTNARGEYSLSGAIFLSSKNNNDFTDFNSIFYGHQMDNKVMFGEIGDFLDKNFFNARQYGNLYFGKKDHGVEFFAFIHTDAYNHQVFTAGVGEEISQEYLDNILSIAINNRDVDVSIKDNIILLSTCSSVSTNGRDILIGRITEEIFENPFFFFFFEISTKILVAESTEYLSRKEVNISILGALLVAFTIIIIVYYNAECKRRRADERKSGRQRM